MQASRQDKVKGDHRPLNRGDHLIEMKTTVLQGKKFWTQAIHDSTFPSTSYDTFSKFRSETQCVNSYGNDPF